MAAGNLNMYCEQGATFTRELTWSDEEEVAVPLAGYTARMQIRIKINSTNIIHSLTTENSGIVLTSPGEIALYISATDTATFPTGTAREGKDYFYDLELEAADGVVTRLLQGQFTISPEVTR